MYKSGSLDFGAVIGHSRSSVMSPFDRAHATSYSTLAETVRLSCRPPYRFRDIASYICRKSPTLTHPPAFGAFVSVDSGRISRWSLASEIYILCGTVIEFCLSIVVEHRLVTDRQTDRHWAIVVYHPSIASRGKKERQKAREKGNLFSIDLNTATESLLTTVFPARRYASAVYAVALCLSVTTHFYVLGPGHIFGADDISNLVYKLNAKSTAITHVKVLQYMVHLGSRDLLKFWEISANISETVQDRDIVRHK